MIVLYILLAIIILIAILAIIAPKTYHVPRSVIINRPTHEVFEYLKYLKNQDEWSPWARKDPDMVKTFTGTDGEIGFVSKWEGNKHVGSGEQEITEIFEGKRIESQLRFFKPWKSISNAFMVVEPVGEETEVTWGFDGENKFPSSIFMLFMNMDKMIGKDFEEGLVYLKERLEKR